MGSKLFAHTFKKNGGAFYEKNVFILYAHMTKYLPASIGINTQLLQIRSLLSPVEKIKKKSRAKHPRKKDQLQHHVPLLNHVANHPGLGFFVLLVPNPGKNDDIADQSLEHKGDACKTP